MGAEAQLSAHLALQLGEWPPSAPYRVTTSAARTKRGWDGSVRPFAGLQSPLGTVLSVAPHRLEAARACGSTFDEALPCLAELFGTPIVHLVFRWCSAPAELEPLGEWVPHADPRVPQWLRPFGGDVLVAFDDGAYLGGVGLKRHDDHAWEIAVGTDERARGRGFARRLVATAARHVLETGRAVTYLHELSNHASARVADAAGFPDAGWRMLDAEA
jgi:RimJ/RimL family protein N-acetyltransferase